ncbi:MAG: hypothetical protein OEZ39_15045 [Gammaproteobacteria bacterium]|nr:hypothetical protein [Gammaproteobacteria bacterium]MDH5653170.1 hypothetical protein [Gammaproteobacteria bacterium]
MSEAQKPIPPIPVAEDEVAWVTIQTTLSHEQLVTLCHDIEVMFRLNPYYRFSAWKQTGQDGIHVQFKNESTQQDHNLQLQIGDKNDAGCTVYYSHGLKKRTIFAVQRAESGSNLVILDEYEKLSLGEEDPRMAEVDKSLTAWGAAIRRYIIRQQRYGKIPGWRWYIRRLWLPMNPSARRVVWFIWLISIFELGVFLFALLIYIIERNVA